MGFTVNRIGDYTYSYDLIIRNYAEVIDTTPNACGRWQVDWGDGSQPYEAWNQFQTWSWTNVFGSTYDQTVSVIHNYPAPGNYVITVSATQYPTCNLNSPGQTVSATVPVYVPATGSSRGPTLLYDGSNAGSFTDIVGNKFKVTPIGRGGKTLSTIDWSIRDTTTLHGDAVTDQIVTKGAGFANTPFGNNGVVNGASPIGITQYWGPNGGQKSIDATFHYTDSTSDSLGVNVDISIPTGFINKVSLGTPTLLFDGINVSALSSGADRDTAPGFRWQANVNSSTTNGNGGRVGIVQTIIVYDVEKIWSVIGFGSWLLQYGVDAERVSHLPLLDDLSSSSSVFYGAFYGDGTSDIANALQQEDTPQVIFIEAGIYVAPGYIFVTDHQVFSQTLMYRPSSSYLGDGIYVPIGRLKWMWSASWQKSQPLIIKRPIGPKILESYKATTSYPTWTAIGSPYSGSSPVHAETKL